MVGTQWAEGDLFRVGKHFRYVFSGVDLLHAEHGGHVGDAPGVDVEHGRDGHVHILAVEAALGGAGAQRREPGYGVQHELAVAEEDALGQARGARGVEGRGPEELLVEVREVGQGLGVGQELFIFPRSGGREVAGASPPSVRCCR